MKPTPGALEKLVSELHMVVCTTLGLDHPLAVQLREAHASKDEQAMERARDAWLELGPQSCERIMSQVAALHRDRIQFAFGHTQAAATALLEAIDHPAFKQLRAAASFARSLDATSAGLLDLAEANRRFSEALTAWNQALTAGEVDLNLQFRQAQADDVAPTTH
jgi:hypothetical protein